MRPKEFYLMDAKKLAYLKTMEIAVWLSKTTEPALISSLEALKLTISSCQRCRLGKTRTQIVFGTGNQEAGLMIIGEAPGFYEDQQGEPFVGRAGQLLNSMLGSIELSRDQVFIANILKCRPPDNRDPLPDEVEACSGYLQEQINMIKPKVICALGRIAAHYLLKTEQALGKLRSTEHAYNGIPVLVTYHPAYLLRNPLDKKKAYDDLLRLKTLC
jgi:uracil-DNA glycosylase family 4